MYRILWSLVETVPHHFEMNSLKVVCQKCFGTDEPFNILTGKLKLRQMKNRNDWFIVFIKWLIWGINFIDLTTTTITTTTIIISVMRVLASCVYFFQHVIVLFNLSCFDLGMLQPLTQSKGWKTR